MTARARALSLIVPAYNERKRLPQALAAIRCFIERRAIPGDEVIVVDDGSTDATAALVIDSASRWPKLRLVQLPRNRGKGAAIRAGVEASSGVLVAFTDADLAVHLGVLDALLDDLAFSDLAIASRAVPGARLIQRQGRVRESFGKLYSRVARMFLVRGIPDAHCGLKAYRAEAARAIYAQVREDGVLFDTEAMLVAALERRPMTQRPSVWKHQPDSRVPMTPRTVVTIVTGIVRLKVRHRSLWPPAAHDVTPDGAR